MKIGQRGYRRTPWWCWAIAIVAAAAVVPGAAIGTSSDKKDSSSPPSAEGKDAAATPDSAKAADVPAARPHPLAKGGRPKAAKPDLAPPMDEIDRMLKRAPAAAPLAMDQPKEPAYARLRDAKAAREDRSVLPPARDADPLFAPAPSREAHAERVPTLAPARPVVADGSANPWGREVSRFAADPIAEPSRYASSREGALYAQPQRRDGARVGKYDDALGGGYGGYGTRVLYARPGTYVDGVKTYGNLDNITREIGEARGLDKYKSLEFLKKLLK